MLMLTLRPMVDTDTVDMAVDTDMVDTVVDTMVDTVARGPLMPMLMPKLTMVDTTAVDTMADTVMAVMVVIVDITTDKSYQDLFLSKKFLLRFYFFVKFVHLSKSSKRIKSLDAHQSQINFMMLKKLK